jgi:hypothetical protein
MTRLWKCKPWAFLLVLTRPHTRGVIRTKNGTNRFDATFFGNEPLFELLECIFFCSFDFIVVVVVVVLVVRRRKFSQIVCIFVKKQRLERDSQQTAMSQKQIIVRCNWPRPFSTLFFHADASMVRHFAKCSNSNVFFVRHGLLPWISSRII